MVLLDVVVVVDVVVVGVVINVVALELALDVVVLSVVLILTGAWLVSIILVELREELMNLAVMLFRTLL